MSSFPHPPFYAIIGQPVGHSLSPLMHATAFHVLGVQREYIAVDIPPSHLAERLQELVARGCAGFNVTIPHKQAIIPLLTRIDDEARTIGAVNTVVVQDGELHGLNTDVYGLLKSLEPFAERIKDNRVILLGAGGAARAVMHCVTKHFKPSWVCIVTRRPDRGEQLARSLDTTMILQVLSFGDGRIDQLIRDATLIVNATPVGMSPDISRSPLPDTTFHRDQIVFDLIYSPLQTTLLKTAASAGAITVGGLEMLIQQGAKAFELWTGQQMPVEAVRKALNDRLGVEYRVKGGPKS